MKRTFGIALFSLVAALFFCAPAANAQSVDFRIGNGGYGNHGYGHRGGGVSVDIHIGGGHRGGWYEPSCGPRCYPPAPPVYRDGCRRGCDDGYYGRDYYRPQTIQVLVVDYVTRYDYYGRPCGTQRVETWVTGYWDSYRGGYYDRYGRFLQR